MKGELLVDINKTRVIIACLKRLIRGYTLTDIKTYAPKGIVSIDGSITDRNMFSNMIIDYEKDVNMKFKDISYCISSSIIFTRYINIDSDKNNRSSFSYDIEEYGKEYLCLSEKMALKNKRKVMKLVYFPKVISNQLYYEIAFNIGMNTRFIAAPMDCLYGFLTNHSSLLKWDIGKKLIVIPEWNQIRIVIAIEGKILADRIIYRSGISGQSFDACVKTIIDYRRFSEGLSEVREHTKTYILDNGEISTKLSEELGDAEIIKAEEYFNINSKTKLSMSENDIPSCINILGLAGRRCRLNVWHKLYSS